MLVCRLYFELPIKGYPLLLRPGYSRLISATTTSRLRTLFLEGGTTKMPDHAFLELVFFRAIPKQDVKPLMQHLLENSGDFNHVLSTSVN
jgi:DNA repair protein RadC